MVKASLSYWMPSVVTGETKRAALAMSRIIKFGLGNTHLSSQFRSKHSVVWRDDLRNTQRELQMSGRDPKQPKSVHSADNCPAHPLNLETFVYRKPKYGSWFHLFLNTVSQRNKREP